MHLVEQYALSCGVKIDTPHIETSYFPISSKKYITLHASNRIQSKTYDYYNDVMDLVHLYLKENDIEFDDSISEEVIGFGEILPKGEYVLVNDILNKEEEELSAKKGDKVIAFDDEPPIDTVLGVEIFPVIHAQTQEKIYVSLEDIKDV